MARSLDYADTDPLGNAIGRAVDDAIGDACAERDCFTDTDPILATAECVCYDPATYRHPFADLTPHG